MNSETVSRLRKWFFDYARSFQSRRPERGDAFLLKLEHTKRVCENIVLIAQEQPSMTEERLHLAEAVGLLHDVGRFSQYELHGTFDDRTSVNHGKLGAEILAEEGPPDTILTTERQIIMDAVRFHNALRLPSLDTEALFFLKLLRDADKLDIWRVMIDAYERRNASAATLGLPEHPECSKDIISAIMDRRMASLSKVSTLNDLKLVHLSWVFELNFATTYRLLWERGYIQKTAASLPRTADVLAAVSVVESFTREHRQNT